MKIYTKRGDNGTTSLIGGDRVLKSHYRIEAYGTIDELNSHIGILRSFVNDHNNQNVLKEVQDRLFTIGSLLASAPTSKMIVPDLNPSDTELLENSMDKMNEELPELRAFILPAGSLSIAQCHVARCVCRRAERLVVALSQIEKLDDVLIIEYLNRLSDYLFVLSRYVGKAEGVKEVNWHPRITK
ncbi:MAG: cob(I)yrinic acid a,c-diamide adenosyltransferase [Bacteroidota bacterium]|nr:cob(I)yrinic acid a,c-diamide adenosyltransferase [Bacteroidota bacterium]